VGLLGNKYGPANVLPVMMVSFGAMTLLAASAQNFVTINYVVKLGLKLYARVV
jgi:hypothetical protein